MKSSSQKAKGTLDDLSAEQARLVERMKQELAAELSAHPELCTTWHILRFLRARDFHFERAKQMLADFLAFRSQKDFKRIAAIDQLDARAALLRQHYTSGHYGTDFEGRLVLIERVGGYNPDALYRHFTPEDIEDYLIQIHERMMFVELPISSRTFRRRIDNTFLIIDLKNVNVLQLFQSKLKSFVRFGTKIGQDYYPEILAKSVFINTPLIFRAIWAVISVWMDKKTVAKFEFQSGNGLKALAKYLNTDLLPAEIGGKNPLRLTEGFGPWKDELADSYRRRSFFLRDRAPEYDYYYTPEEARRAGHWPARDAKLDDLTRSTVIDREPLLRSAPSIREIKVSNFRVSIRRFEEV